MDHITNLQKDFQEVKIGLELVKKDIQQFQRIIDKLDVTNEKIQELIMNISKITSLHEQKLFENLKDVEEVWNDMERLDKRVTILEKYKWLLVGGISLGSFLINIAMQVWLNK
jgi:hypothetical protein